MDGSCELKVKAIKNHALPSFTTHQRFDMLPILNTTYKNAPSIRYGKDADIALMDGKKACLVITTMIGLALMARIWKLQWNCLNL